MDVCYVSYLYFRAEIANYIENLYFVGGNCAKTLPITKNTDLLHGLLIILKEALLLFTLKFTGLPDLQKVVYIHPQGFFYLSGLPNNFSIKLLGPLFSVFLAR